jgi:hypothetical protein
MVNLLACHQCGGVIEVALLGALTLIVSLGTSVLNYVRKKLHDRRPREPQCKICGCQGDIDRNRRCIQHRFDENARRLW